jgi:hypothetical protein
MNLGIGFLCGGLGAHDTTPRKGAALDQVSGRPPVTPMISPVM